MVLLLLLSQGNIYCREDLSKRKSCILTKVRKIIRSISGFHGSSHKQNFGAYNEHDAKSIETDDGNFFVPTSMQSSTPTASASVTESVTESNSLSLWPVSESSTTLVSEKTTHSAIITPPTISSSYSDNLTRSTGSTTPSSDSLDSESDAAHALYQKVSGDHKINVVSLPACVLEAIPNTKSVAFIHSLLFPFY